MKKVMVLALPLLLVASLGLAGCSHDPEGTGSNGGAYATPDVTMNQMGFDHDTLTIPGGTPVNFIDPASASLHILCVGKNGACDMRAQGPTPLTSGNTLQVTPGQTKTVTFDAPGVYSIICTLHPMMNLTITVQ